MADNEFAEGTLEWYAWGNGNDYGQTQAKLEDPMSGEWADGPIQHHVIIAVWRAIMGESWNTFEDGREDDRDADNAILDAWEEGYRAAYDH